ncbi:MAG: hypothetical protein ACLU38_03210 [Dysosmobacter sp.]
MTRQDGRAYDELRPIKITTDFVKFPEGSCLIECGDTKVLCCASIEEQTPAPCGGGRRAGSRRSIPCCPGPTGSASKRDISKLKLSPRSAEIQRLVGRSLRAAVDMKAAGRADHHHRLRRASGGRRYPHRLRYRRLCGPGPGLPEAGGGGLCWAPRPSATLSPACLPASWTSRHCWTCSTARTAGPRWT